MDRPQGRQYYPRQPCGTAKLRLLGPCRPGSAGPFHCHGPLWPRQYSSFMSDPRLERTQPQLFPVMSADDSRNHAQRGVVKTLFFLLGPPPPHHHHEEKKSPFFLADFGAPKKNFFFLSFFQTLMVATGSPTQRTTLRMIRNTLAILTWPILNLPFSSGHRIILHPPLLRGLNHPSSLLTGSTSMRLMRSHQVIIPGCAGVGMLRSVSMPTAGGLGPPGF